MTCKKSNKNKIFFSVKPKLTVSDTTSLSGDSITFTCSTPGDASSSNIVYKLYKGTDEIATSPDINVGGSYTIASPTTADTDSYSCTATVDGGSESPKSYERDLNVVGKQRAHND